MGQYYTLCNLDKRQRLSISLSLWGTMFFSGQKHLEQLANLGFKPFLALALVDMAKVANNPNALWGSWSGDRVVLLGDYSDDIPEFLTDDEKLELKTKSITLPALVQNEFEDLMKDPAKWFMNNEMLDGLFKDPQHVIVNLDQLEYLDPDQFGDESSVDKFCLEKDGVMKGLYSTLFYSTGKGGGDIEHLKIGRWAGDRLSIVEMDTLPEFYRDVSGPVETLLRIIN